MRRTYREGKDLENLQGIRATTDGGVCDLCGLNILKEQRIYKPRGKPWVHAGCWAGGHE